MVEESMSFVDMIVVGAVVLPGFLLCVPGLLLVIVPVVAIGLLATAACLVILLVEAANRVLTTFPPSLRRRPNERWSGSA